MSEVIISVVIPAYYRPDLLEKAIRSCMTQTLSTDNYEIIVVDSSSDDRNVKLVESLQPESKCSLTCLTKVPEGPGPSRNLGGQHARGRILAFMDSDCQAYPGWLEAAVAAFDEKISLVQGRTVPEPGAPYSVFNRSFQIEKETIIYEALNIFYRRDVFLEHGGFAAEENPTAMSVLGGEDVDLAWRVKRSGWESSFATDAVVTHIVERQSVWQWLYDKRMTVVPRIPKDFPETRQFFFARYFYDDIQAYLILAMAGASLSFLLPATLLATIPYCLRRGSEPTKALPGPLRLLRIVVYLPRDLLTCIALLRGSLRYRTVLL